MKGKKKERKCEVCCFGDTFSTEPPPPGRGQMKVPHPRKGDLAAARSRTVSGLGEAKQLVLVIAAPGVSPEAKCF